MDFFSRILMRSSKKYISREDITSRVSILMNIAVFLLIHLIFLIYFLSIGAMYMVLVNAASFVFYATAFFVINIKRGQLSSFLITLEVGLYCIAAAYFVGWDVGTHVFLAIMIFPVFMLFRLSNYKIYLYTAILFVSMAVCYYFKSSFGPYYMNFDWTILTALTLIIYMCGGLLMVTVMHLSNKFIEERYISEIENLAGQANRDSLTDLWNRRYAEQAMMGIFIDKEQRRHDYLAMADIDFFKQINDTYGHEIGDKVLCEFAAYLTDSFRGSDICVRWGGEEFLIILSDISESSTFRALDNFRKRIENADLDVDGIKLKITVTIGFCSCVFGDSYLECIKMCDEALYHGKHNGRNATVNFSNIVK